MIQIVFLSFLADILFVFYFVFLSDERRELDHIVRVKLGEMLFICIRTCPYRIFLKYKSGSFMCRFASDCGCSCWFLWCILEVKEFWKWTLFLLGLNPHIRKFTCKKLPLRGGFSHCCGWFWHFLLVKQPNSIVTLSNAVVIYASLPQCVCVSIFQSIKSECFTCEK